MKALMLMIALLISSVCLADAFETLDRLGPSPELLAKRRHEEAMRPQNANGILIAGSVIADQL